MIVVIGLMTFFSEKQPLSLIAFEWFWLNSSCCGPENTKRLNFGLCIYNLSLSSLIYLQDGNQACFIVLANKNLLLFWGASILTLLYQEGRCAPEKPLEKPVFPCISGIQEYRTWEFIPRKVFGRNFQDCKLDGENFCSKMLFLCKAAQAQRRPRRTQAKPGVSDVR